MTFQSLASYFPLVIAPGVVAYLRRRWPALAPDGLLVWLAVVLAAVGFSAAIDFAFGVPLGVDVMRRGVLLGLTSATAHTLASGKGRMSAPSIPPPAESGERPIAVEASQAWGPGEN